MARMKLYNKYGQYFTVDAQLNAEEGVFGMAQDVDEPDRFHMLGGDDGHWWIAQTFNKYWLPVIKNMVTAFEVKDG